MDLFFTFDVTNEILKKCKEITGLNASVNRDAGGEIQIVAMKYKVTDNTKLIQGVYASLDSLKLKDIPPSVTVCKNAGAFAGAGAEHVMALMLTATKKIIDLNNKTHHRVFRKETVGSLRGKKIGIIGYGALGREIAALAKAFGMSVIAYTRTQRDDPKVDQFVVSIARLITLSDIIVITLPLTNKTRGIINADALNMFNGNIIVNIARADIVNKNDLLFYLKRFPEKFYLADVWWNEPVLSEEVPPNVILTPHVADAVIDDFDAAVIMACENVKKFLDGRPEGVVDPTEYY